MVSRAAKHVFSRYLRKLPLLDVPSCVAHLLNCLVGYKLNPCPQAQSSEDEYSTTSSEPEWAQLNGVKMHQEVVKEVFKRFRFQLEEEWWTQCKPLMLLREICLKMGFQLKAREYTFEKSAVVFNGTSKPKKAVNGVDGHKPAETTFTAEDVLNVVPIVKDAPLKVLIPLASCLMNRVLWRKKLSKQESMPYSRVKRSLVWIFFQSLFHCTNKSTVYSIRM